MTALRAIAIAGVLCVAGAAFAIYLFRDNLQRLQQAQSEAHSYQYTPREKPALDAGLGDGGI